MFNLFASFAEFERELISERTKAGLEHARKNGRKGGRKPGLSKANQAKALAAMKLLEDTSNNLSVSEIRERVGLSKSSYYRYIEWVKKEEKANH